MVNIIKSFQNLTGRFGKLNSFRIISKVNCGINNIELGLAKEALVSYPPHLDIVATKLCNLRCIFCIQYAAGNVKNLSLENFKIIAKKFFPYAKMAHFVSDGEPFLNGDFMKFLSVCREYNLPTRVSTNGMLLSEETCRELVKNDFLKIFRFSFDGSKKETVESIRRGIDYDRVVSSMRLMADLKKKYIRNDLTLLIRYAVMKSNVEELPDLVKKAGQWGIDMVHACYLNVVNEIEQEESLYYHYSMAKRIFEESVKVAEGAKIRLVLPEPLDRKSRIRKCCHPWRFIKIDPDGSIRFCYKAWGNPIDNIFSSELPDVWNNSYYRLIRKTVNSENPYFKYCKICSWRQGYALESSHIQNLHSELYGFDTEHEKPR